VYINFGHIPSKKEVIIEQFLQGKKVKGSDKGLVRLRLDKDLYFNPTRFYKCSLAGTEQRSSNLREEEIKQFGNNHFRYQFKVKVINPDRTREECQEHLWNINAGQPYGMNFATFIIHFDEWWNKSKLEGEYLHVPLVLQHIHFNENANLDKGVKRKIIAEIVGILKSMKTQEAIRKIRKEHAEMKKSQMEKICEYSTNTIRRYWEKDILYFDEELTRINLKYI
jgi:hypothetical protein